MDAGTITGLSDKKNFDASVLHSLPKIIIKKENIGLEAYQHQKYQYSLFSNNAKRDQFYEDLSKMKDRMERGAPNMQQVIHMDMKRANTNKVYERKLSRELTGPRGLNWQFKQELQRLESDEREIERDLKRFNRDLARPSYSSLLDQNPLSDQNKDYYRLPTPRWSLSNETNSPNQTPRNSKVILGRTFSINTNPATVDRFTPVNRKRLPINKTSSLNEKYPWMSKRINSTTNENRPYFQQHADSINQQKREIEQKLKQFLH